MQPPCQFEVNEVARPTFDTCCRKMHLATCARCGVCKPFAHAVRVAVRWMLLSTSADLPQALSHCLSWAAADNNFKAIMNCAIPEAAY